MLRRNFLSYGALVTSLLATGGCSFRNRPPDGWKRVTAGPASFFVPKNWRRVEIPDDASLVGWDWVMQDTAKFHDESATCRALVMTHGLNAIISNPPKDDTRKLAEFLSQTEIFGGGTAVGINGSPRRIKGDPDQLFRMDYRETIDSEDTRVSDFAFVGQDDGEPEIAIVGLTGPGITESILNTVASGIEVHHD